MFLRQLVKDKSSWLYLFKNVTNKDTTYWAAESWEGVTELSLRKTWKNLCLTPGLVEIPEEVKETEELVQLAHEISGSEKQAKLLSMIDDTGAFKFHIRYLERHTLKPNVHEAVAKHCIFQQICPYTPVIWLILFPNM